MKWKEEVAANRMKRWSSSNMRCGRQYRGLKEIHRLSLSVVLWPMIEKEDVRKFQRPKMPLMRKQYYFGMIINYFEQDLLNKFILERVVLNQLLEHLEGNNLVEPYQSANRKNHSTESALLRIVNDILLSIDRRNASILTLLDLSAAFDTIDHTTLLMRLESNFGIKCKALSWFQSYLTDRFQSVEIKGLISDKRSLHFGVPQGSVLGPILFTLYMMPLGKVIQNHSVDYHMYADDTQLYKEVVSSGGPDSVKAIENCCLSVSDWMQDNKLKLNEEKTEIMFCSSKFKTRSFDLKSINISGVGIDLSEKAKNLGVILDNKLSMTSHISFVVKCMYLEIRKLSRLKHLLSVRSMKTLVSALILSRLDYCNSLLAGLPEEEIDRLQKAQNCAARMVLGRSRYESSTEMLKSLHWLPVRARIEYKTASLCYVSFQSSAPVYLKAILPPYNPSRNLRSQDSKLLSVPKTRSKHYGDRAFCKFGPNIWNNLPSSLRHAENIENFKRLLKTHLFRKYFN